MAGVKLFHLKGVVSGKWLEKGCIGLNHYENKRLKLFYPRIIFIGRSFGGSYVPLLPRFDKRIKELGLIYPAVDNKSCGSIKGEESNEDFIRAMKLDGYHHLYRGILSEGWKKHLNGEDGLLPIDNIDYLQSTRLFIGHGRKDRCIHYSKSVAYFQKIMERFPQRKNQFMLKLYPKTGHNPQTSNVAVKDFLNWLGVKESK